MPEYARTFYERWRTEYIPEIKSYWNKILDFDFENSTIPQALIHMEDCLDMQERAFKIHWIINLAQFKASSDFVDYYAELFGGVDNEVGKINVSTDDRNWDSLRELWKMKEFVKNRPALKKLFDENENHQAPLLRHTLFIVTAYVRLFDVKPLSGRCTAEGRKAQRAPLRETTRPRPRAKSAAATIPAMPYSKSPV
jgi:hypothetical protein